MGADMNTVNKIAAAAYRPAYVAQREALNEPGISERWGSPELQKIARECRRLEKSNLDRLIAMCDEILAPSPAPDNPFFSGDVAGRVHLGEVNERLWVGW